SNDSKDMMIAWCSPNDNWIKLNCDGAVTDYGLKASCEGVLRNSDGEFIVGFSRNLGTCSITTYQGLQVAIGKGFQKILIESDSLAAINIIAGGCSISHPCFGLVNDIKNKATQVTEVRFMHMFREANQVADALAKFGLSQLCLLRIYDVPPDFISFPLLADRIGTLFPRGF
ncbi:ribonuclease H, partial [Trifolium pratense]